MKTEPTMYPTLTEHGEKEAQAIMDSFKPRLKSLMDEALGELYVDVMTHVESDSWSNYRNSILNGLKDYKTKSGSSERDFKEIRQEIYLHNREEINKDLNQDLLNEIERLKRTIEMLHAQGYPH